jgi:hypothetical protein
LVSADLGPHVPFGALLSSDTNLQHGRDGGRRGVLGGGVDGVGGGGALASDSSMTPAGARGLRTPKSLARARELGAWSGNLLEASEATGGTGPNKVCVFVRVCVVPRRTGTNERKESTQSKSPHER